MKHLKQKKENNNKDYRIKKKAETDKYQYLYFDYILRTQHGLTLTNSEKSYLNYYYESEQRTHPGLVEFENRSQEENKIIQEVMKQFKLQYINSVEDKTHTNHSKMQTRNRNQDRQLKKSTLFH